MPVKTKGRKPTAQQVRKSTKSPITRRNAATSTATRSRMDTIVTATGDTGFVRSMDSGEIFRVVSKDRSVLTVVPLSGKGAERKYGSNRVQDVPKPKTEKEAMPRSKSSKAAVATKTTATGSAAKRGKQIVEDDDEEDEDDEPAPKITRKGGAKVAAVVDEDEDTDDDEDMDDDDETDDEEDEDEDDEEDEEDEDEEDEDDEEEDEDGEDEDEDDDEEAAVAAPAVKAKKSAAPTPVAASSVNETVLLLKELIASSKENTRLLVEIQKAASQTAGAIVSASKVVTTAPTAKSTPVVASANEVGSVAVRVTEIAQVQVGSLLKVKLSGETTSSKATVTKIGKEKFFAETGTEKLGFAKADLKTDKVMLLKY